MSPKTWQDRLRNVPKNPDRVRDLLDDIAPAVEAAQRLDNVEGDLGALDVLVEAAQAWIEMLEHLGFSTAEADEFAAALDKAQDSGPAAEAIDRFAEEHESAMSYLDGWEEAKAADPYPGKRDDVEAAREELVAACYLLADALDEIEPVTITAEQE